MSETVNESGIEPFGNKILVLPDQVEHVTKGGIQLPGDIVEREELAKTEGVLISWGGNAFAEITANGFVSWRMNATPKSGSRCVFAKYAGQMLDGADGKRYRLINDTDLLSIRTKQLES